MFKGRCFGVGGLGRGEEKCSKKTGLKCDLGVTQPQIFIDSKEDHKYKKRATRCLMRADLGY